MEKLISDNFIKTSESTLKLQEIVAVFYFFGYILWAKAKKLSIRGAKKKCIGDDGE